MEGGVESRRKDTFDEIWVAKEPWIFAMQYRVIKKKGSWLITNKPKINDVDIGYNLILRCNAMYGEEKDELEDTIEDEDEDWEEWGPDEEDVAAAVRLL